VIPPILSREVDGLKRIGYDLEIIEIGGQCYVLVRKIPARSPPWDRTEYEILIAIPTTYDDAALDAFYLEEPHAYSGGEHERVRGARVNGNGKSWRLASWHYTNRHPWRHGSDSLETHIMHCMGFFIARGVKND